MASRILILLVSVLATAPVVAADKVLRTGKEVVDAVCTKCHQAGLKGAPKIGDRDAWIPRLQRGIDQLALSAIRGHDGMPARGGHAEFTDGEVRDAIIYMFDPEAMARAAARPPKSAAKVDPNEAIVDGMEIRFGLMSAERLRAYPKGSPESLMHGGVPKASGYYHVNVSLFDAKSRAAIPDAAVEVEVRQAGSETQTKALEPVKQLNAASYGHYLKLVPRKPANIAVRVRKAGSDRTAEARFRPTPE